MDFLKLPLEKLKNKVICDKHFPETSFMNYTRSKLNKTTAVPTIYIDPNDAEIDLLETPTSFVIENQAKKAGSFAISSNNVKSEIDMADDSISEPQIIVIKQTPGPSPAKRLKTELPVVPQKSTGMRILNKLPVTTATTSNQSITISQFKEATQKSPTNQKYSKTRVKLIEKPKVFPTKSTPKVIKHEILVAPITEEEQFKEIDLLPEEVSYSSTISLPPTNEPSQEEFKALFKDVAEIKTFLLNEKIQPAPQVPSTSINILNESNITQSHLNKIQLFNGIKRYLSPSLIALLRMEIFAAPNREYKKDEKIICDEILKLGEEVYDFFSDEWRLRLPSKDQVKGWQSDDLIDDDAS